MRCPSCWPGSSRLEQLGRLRRSLEAWVENRSETDVFASISKAKGAALSPQSCVRKVPEILEQDSR